MRLTGGFATLPQTDQADVRRVLGRYPDVYECKVWHTPGFPHWTFWIGLPLPRGGVASALIQHKHVTVQEDELRAAVEQNLRALRERYGADEKAITGAVHPDDWTLADYITVRLADYEHGGMSLSQLDQERSAGTLAGLEFLEEEGPVREGDSLFLPGKTAPVVDHLKRKGRLG